MAAVAEMRGHGDRFALCRHAACRVAPRAARLSNEHCLVRAGEVAAGAVSPGVVVADVASYNVVTGWDGTRQAMGGTGQNGTSARRSGAGRDGTGNHRTGRAPGGAGRDKQWPDRTGCGVMRRGRRWDRAERDRTGHGGAMRGGRGVTWRAARVGRNGTISGRGGTGRDGTNSEQEAAGVCQDQRRWQSESEIGRGMPGRGGRDRMGQQRQGKAFFR